MDRPTGQHSGDHPRKALTGGWNNVSKTRPVTGFQEVQNTHQRRMEAEMDAELVAKRTLPEVSASCDDPLMEKRDKVEIMKQAKAPFGAYKLGLDSGGGRSSADSEIQPNLFSACDGGYRLPQRPYKPPSSKWELQQPEPLATPRPNEGGPGPAQTSRPQSMDTVPKARPKGDSGSGMSAAGNYAVPVIPRRHYSLVREVLDAYAEGAAKLKKLEAEAQKAAKEKDSAAPKPPPPS